MNNYDFLRTMRAFFSQQGRPIIIFMIAGMYGKQALKFISFKMFGYPRLFPCTCGISIRWGKSTSLIASFHNLYRLSPLLFFCVPPAVDDNTWAQVIGLYPTLVECITCSSSEVSSALKEALGPFKDFMQPPVARVQNGET